MGPAITEVEAVSPEESTPMRQLELSERRLAVPYCYHCATHVKMQKSLWKLSIAIGGVVGANLLWFSGFPKIPASHAFMLLGVTFCLIVALRHFGGPLAVKMKPECSRDICAVEFSEPEHGVSTFKFFNPAYGAEFKRLNNL